LAIPEFLWVLTRNQFPDPALIRRIYSKIRHLGLDTRRLVVTNQKSCPNGYHPTQRQDTETDLETNLVE
jgi:hypothetical protein